LSLKNCYKSPKIGQKLSKIITLIPDFSERLAAGQQPRRACQRPLADHHPGTNLMKLILGQKVFRQVFS
jgi:hypothetical protein